MRKTWLIFSQAVTIVLALLFVVQVFKPDWLQRSSPLFTPQAPYATLALPPPPSASGAASMPPAFSFAGAARRAAPSVVSVVASKAPRNPHFDDPWLRYFFGGRTQQPQIGLGSGVIVSSDGYLLTNNHVVDGASDIEVQFADGRQAKARLVGTDPDTDVAVLKIALARLPAIGFGNVDALQVGDVVLAIGNPFNVGQTVTLGIVSALGRNQLGINTFENFIQTDAAINPGNSGGALVDVNGDLVGINTAIYSRTGGSMGIGFAIPAGTARQVMEGLIRDGQVTRGWIGVEPRDLTPEIAENFGLPVRQGVLITGVMQEGPAGKAGMAPGDVVTQVDGTPVANTAQLLAAVAALKPRSQANIVVQRGAKALSLPVIAAQRPRSKAVQEE